MDKAINDPNVSDLPSIDGFGALWDQVARVIYLKGAGGGWFKISPDEVRRLYLWMEEHALG